MKIYLMAFVFFKFYILFSFFTQQIPKIYIIWDST